MCKGMAQAVGPGLEGIKMVAFLGVYQDIKAAGRVEMVADVKSHREAIEIGIKGKICRKGWRAVLLAGRWAGWPVWPEMVRGQDCR